MGLAPLPLLISSKMASFDILICISKSDTFISKKKFVKCTIKQRSCFFCENTVHYNEKSTIFFFSGESKKEEGTVGSPKVGLLTEASIKDPQISGSRSADGFFEAVMSGKVTGVKGIGDAMLFFVVQKPVDEPTAVGLLADVKKINPSTILSTLLGIDLSAKLPLLGNIEIDVVVEGANKDMLSLKDADLNKLLAKYVNNGKAIAEGFRLKCTIPIRKIISETAKNLPTVKNIPEFIILQVVVTKDKVNFIFPENFQADMVNIVIALTPKLTDKVIEKVCWEKNLTTD